MRSQVSSTASKVSREWSAKRGRARSVSTSQPVVEQEVDRAPQLMARPLGIGAIAPRQSTSNTPAAPMPPPMHIVTHDLLRAAALALDQRVAGQALAADAVGMADGDRAAVDVEPVHRDAERVGAIEHLHRERLVQLPQVDVVDRRGRGA